jgi:hypothetical protein
VAGAAERSERVGRSPLRGQTLDQPRPGALAEWLGGGEGLGRGHGLVDPAGAQQRTRAGFEGASPQLLEASRLGRDARDVSVLGERRAPPKAEGLVEERYGRRRVSSRGVPHQQLEASRVDLVWCRHQRVSRSSTHESVAEDGPQTRHVGAQGRHRTRR